MLFVCLTFQHGPNLDREIVKDADSKGQIPRKLSKAAVKDTVNVPNGGYTVVRFYSNNPGLYKSSFSSFS